MEEEFEEFSAVGDLKCVVASIAGSVATALCLSVGLCVNSEAVSLLWRMSEAAVTLLIIFLISEGSCVKEMASCFPVLRCPNSIV